MAKTKKKIKIKKSKVSKKIKSAKRKKISVPKSKKKAVTKPKKKIIKKPVKKSLKKKITRPKKNISKQKKRLFKPKIYPIKSLQGRVSHKARQFNRMNSIKPRKAVTPAKPKFKKVSLAQQTAEFPAETLFKAKIKVIGIGGGGGSIVSEIGRSLEKATFVIADTDIRALKKRSGIKYFWFGEDLTHGLGTGVDVELAKKAAEDAKEKISIFFKDQDIIIFVASLGGGLGSGATQVFAEAARSFGGITFGIFTMPFRFEGKNKQRIAQNALKSLRQSLNVSLVIPNEKIFKIIDDSTPITNAFSIVNKSLIESLESLIDLIYNPGIINIDFADLRTVLKGRGNSAFLNTVEDSGKNSVENICENIFKNPLLQNNNFKAEKILFNIAGSDNLSMFQVEKISSHIANLNPKAKIIFGISKDNKLKNKIKTTILMTGGQMQEEIILKEPVKKAESAKQVIIEKQVKELLGKEIVKEKIPVKKVKVRKTKISKDKKTKPKKPINKKQDKEEIIEKNKKEPEPVSIIPVFQVPVNSIPVLEQRKIDIVEATSNSAKKTIRRSGLEIKKAEELQEKKRLAQEKEWEIPAFLRKVKLR